MARTVFLDQNHWIYLGQAFWGRPHRLAHQALAGWLRAEVEADRIRLPLGTIHMIEHLRHGNRPRRERLAQVFEVFGRGWFIASWGAVLRTEIGTAVAATFGLPIPAQTDVFGRGFLFGLERKERELLQSRWSDEELNTLSLIAAQPGAVYGLLTQDNEANRDSQNRAISELSTGNAAAAEVLRGARKPYPTAMHRRAQYARYTLELQDDIREALALGNRSIDDFIALGVDGLCTFWQGIPSLHVDCELTLYRDRQWQRRVEPNDVRDIGHLATAIPYCDAVVVERFWARAIEETGLAEKYNTCVYTDLEQLAAARVSAV